MDRHVRRNQYRSDYPAGHDGLLTMHTNPDLLRNLILLNYVQRGKVSHCLFIIKQPKFLP